MRVPNSSSGLLLVSLSETLITSEEEKQMGEGEAWGLVSDGPTF